MRDGLSCATVISVNPLYLITHKKSKHEMFDVSSYWWKPRHTKKVWRSIEKSQRSCYIKIKIEKKLFKNVLIHHIGYVMVQDLSYATINSVTPLPYHPIKKLGSWKCLALVLTDESKDTLKRMKNYGTKLEIFWYQ